MKIGGTVIEGDGVGRTLGFPTINIDRDEYERTESDLELGVYAGLVKLPGGELCKAGMVVGPLDAEGLPKIEAHLIDYNNDLYGEEVVFYFLEFLRQLKQYESDELLVEAITADIKNIKHMELCLPES